MENGSTDSSADSDAENDVHVDQLMHTFEDMNDGETYCDLSDENDPSGTSMPDPSAPLLPDPPLPTSSSHTYPCATMEDVTSAEEEESQTGETYIEAYPRPAGTQKGRSHGTFQRYQQRQEADGEAPWAPFESEAEWELARWVMTSGVSHNKANEFLKQEKVRTPRTVVLMEQFDD